MAFHSLTCLSTTIISVMGSTSTHNNVNCSGNDVWDHEQQGEASDRKLGNSLLVQMS